MKMYQKLQYIKVLLSVLVLAILSSCYQYDPIEAKERLLANLKENPDNKGGGTEPVNPEPITPEIPEEPRPENPKEDDAFINIHFNFDKWAKKPNSPYFLPLNSDKEDPANTYWVSASNRGYTNFSSKLEEFPVLELKDGYKNSGVKLISRPPIGAKAPFAPQLLAGSLYSGLVVGGAMNQNPTRFGQAWNYEPKQIKLYYKYEAGNQPINGLQGLDKGSVNAVLYDITYDKNYLDKTSVKNDSRILLQAYQQVGNQADWTELALDFKVVNQSLFKKINFEKRKYRLALIFSSSAKGNEYIGALGSTLCIDELTVVCKNKKKKTEEGQGGTGDKPKEEVVETLVSFDKWKTITGKHGTYSELLSEGNGLEWVAPNNELYNKNGWPKPWYTYSYPITELKRAKSASGCLLETRGSYLKTPKFIIAGEIYNGYTKPNRIGQDWDKGEPTQISFNYKYKAGASTVYGKLKGKDKGSVRALLYEVTDDANYYLNQEELKKKDNERVILEAYQDFGEEEWGQEMTLEFDVKNEARYKVLDFKKKKYRLAIIFSSSYKSLDGKGVWGSTLQIDELKIFSKKK